MIDQDRNSDQLKHSAIVASQAKIVRAFYDAAERLLIGPNIFDDSRQAVRTALDDLSKLVEQAHEVASEYFGQALERAAREYFANVAAIQQTSPQDFGRKH